MELIMRQSTGSRRVAAVLACALGFAACDRGTNGSAEAGAVGGTLVAAVQNEPRLLLPPLIQQLDEKIVSDQIFEPLAWLGDEAQLDRGYRPGLADSWSWESDSTVIVFHLNPKARWHDGVPVRASDVAFTYGLFTDSIVGSKERAALSRIDSVQVRDSATVAFWFRQRYLEQFFDAATRMLIVPEHLLAKEPRATLQTAAFGRHPVGSGRFRFSKWVANSSIELVADTANYRGRPSLDRVIFAVTRDPNALSTRLTTGEIDAAEITIPAMFQAVTATSQFRAKILPAFDYTYLLFNLRDRKNRARPHALFSDVNLRRALSMALDRDRLVQSQFDSMAAVAVGPMTRAQPLADTNVTRIAYDSAGAARLLDSLGWKLPAGKSVRERDGRPLRFAVLVPTVSGNRMALVVRVQQALKQIGVDVAIEALDGNAFVEKLTTRDFDVAFDGRHVDLGISGLRPYWSVATARAPGAPNFGTYENPTFDAQLDSAVAAHDVSRARAHAKRAFETIIADAPAVWMYEARTASLVHKRFRTAHIAPGAWWVGIADWSIPPAERIERDRVRLSTASQ
jgi:peptide/nickel transport system substrate-binding protein